MPTPADRPRPSRLETRDITELRALRQAHPELATAVDMQVELLELQRRIQLRVSTPTPASLGTRQGRLRQGHRAVELAEVPLDWAEARLAARQTADILHRHDLLDVTDHDRLAALFRDGDDLPARVQAWYAETVQGPGGRPAGSREPMLDEVLTLALRPFLVRAVEVAARDLDLRVWDRPWCPFCGAAPDLAVFVSDDQRQLICSRCAARWDWETAACPWCFNRDRSRLKTFTSPDRRYRLCACDGCHRYLKAYNARGASRPVLPAVDGIATLPLDAAAAQRGYLGG
jgi:hypothetical protein